MYTYVQIYAERKTVKHRDKTNMHNNTHGYIYTDKYPWISIDTHRSMHKLTCLCLYSHTCTTWTLDSVFPVLALFTYNYLKALFHLNLFRTCSARLCERCNHTKVLMDDNKDFLHSTISKSQDNIFIFKYWPTPP